jgi:hypothetical protein
MIEAGVGKRDIGHGRGHDRGLSKIRGGEGSLATKKTNMGARGIVTKAVAGDETKTISSEDLQLRKSIASLYFTKFTMVMLQG